MPRRLRPLPNFLTTEAGGGLAIILALAVALIWANGPFGSSYEDFWSLHVSASVGDHELHLDLRHLVNEGLMTVFFFVIGLEVKRELVEGQLSSPRKAAFPVIAAIGGMVVPALIFFAINPAGSPGARGWAIPMATDVAIVLGFLALAVPRVPYGLKVFLLTLAVVDDVGAVLVIALFYATNLDLVALTVAALAIACTGVFRWMNVRPLVAYYPLALATWLALFLGGVSPTLTGVVFGLLASTAPSADPRFVDADALSDVSTTTAAAETVNLAKASVSVVDWLEYRVHPWSSYVVLPLFALANAGIRLDAQALQSIPSSRVFWSVIAALVIGKTVGIFGAAVLALRLRVAALPSDVKLNQLAGVALLAGTGFTVSFFLTELAFTEPDLVFEAKVGTLTASSVAVLGGITLLRRSTRKVNAIE